MLNEFAAKRNASAAGSNTSRIEEEVSVNADTGVDTGALLQGDSNEELRMADRVAEKAENAKQGKMPRVTAEDIRPSQRSFEGTTAVIEEEKKEGSQLLIPPPGAADTSSRRDSASGRKTPRLNAASPNFQKFDANLKKQLLAAERERTEKAKRDADDERKREMEEFKASGMATAANIVMPKYERDTILECDREIGKPPESQFIPLGWDEDSTT